MSINIKGSITGSNVVIGGSQTIKASQTIGFKEPEKQIFTAFCVTMDTDCFQTWTTLKTSTDRNELVEWINAEFSVDNGEWESTNGKVTVFIV